MPPSVFSNKLINSSTLRTGFLSTCVIINPFFMPAFDIRPSFNSATCNPDLRPNLALKLFGTGMNVAPSCSSATEFDLLAAISEHSCSFSTTYNSMCLLSRTKEIFILSPGFFVATVSFNCDEVLTGMFSIATTISFGLIPPCSAAVIIRSIDVYNCAYTCLCSCS